MRFDNSTFAHNYFSLIICIHLQNNGSDEGLYLQLRNVALIHRYLHYFSDIKYFILENGNSKFLPNLKEIGTKRYSLMCYN